LALFPSPKFTTVHSLKSFLSTSLHGTSDPTHGCSGSVHAYHIHLNRNALLKISRSSTPNPPNFFGLCTLGQVTKQCPPFTSSDPFHRKPLRILLILLSIHFLGANMVRKYVGIEESTQFTSFNLPARLRTLPFHVGNLLATLSIKGWMSILCN
jgi:hypothetical protein